MSWGGGGIRRWRENNSQPVKKVEKFFDYMIFTSDWRRSFFGESHIILKKIPRLLLEHWKAELPFFLCTAVLYSKLTDKKQNRRDVGESLLKPRYLILESHCLSLGLFVLNSHSLILCHA